MSDFLPPPDHDPLIRLHDYHFQAADVLFEAYKEARRKLNPRSRPGGAPRIRYQSYAQLWLSLLRTVGEGFEDKSVKSHYESNAADNLDIQIYWDSIHHKLTQLGDELQRYRNVTFHFQPSFDRLTRLRSEFLEHQGRLDPVEWAEELHLEMRKFFRAYRVLSSVKLSDQALRAEHGDPPPKAT